MAEYISREKAIKELREVYENEYPTASGDFDEYASHDVPNVLRNIKAADVQPVKHGRWIKQEGFWNKNTVKNWTCLDVVDRGFPNTIVQDYLTWQTDEKYDFIITNPPYALATEFIEKSMTLLESYGTCCMFLKLQFLEGIRRKDLFDKYPPKYIYVFRSRMATWKNGLEKNPDTGKKWAETIAFAWFVWVKDNQSEPVVRWID